MAAASADADPKADAVLDRESGGAAAAGTAVAAATAEAAAREAAPRATVEAPAECGSGPECDAAARTAVAAAARHAPAAPAALGRRRPVSFVATAEAPGSRGGWRIWPQPLPFCRHID